jgi:hypothetical protein
MDFKNNKKVVKENLVDDTVETSGKFFGYFDRGHERQV